MLLHKAMTFCIKDFLNKFEVLMKNFNFCEACHTKVLRKQGILSCDPNYTVDVVM